MFSQLTKNLQTFTTCGILIAAALLPACQKAIEGPLGSIEDLTGDWEYRKGFDQNRLGPNEFDDWQPVSLPNRLDRFVPELRGYKGWVTLRRPLSETQTKRLHTGTRLSYFSGNIGDVARFYLNDWNIGNLGSAEPYRPAFSRYMMVDLPTIPEPEAGGPTMLTMALYTNGDYPMAHFRRMFIGPTRAVHAEFFKGEILIMAMITVYVILGLYNIGLWFGRRKEFFFLYFGLFAITFSMFVFMNSDSRDLYIDDWIVIRRKIEYAALFMGFPFLLLFLQSFFEAPSRVFRAYVILCLVCTAIAVLAWEPVMMRYALLTWQLLSLAAAVFTVYYLVRNSWNRPRRMLSLGFFCSVFVISCIYDLLAATGVIKTGYISQYTFGLVVLCLGVIIGGRLVRSHNKVEALARHNKRIAGELLKHRRMLVRENTALISSSQALTDHMVALTGGRELVYAAPAMVKTVNMIEKAAGNSETVLVIGESGTGKELASSMIHEKSKRADRPFRAVNCGALSETLLESELFGHERGAFTGAHKDHRGIFEQADGGTIFLDEIGDISPNVQVKLLRVLQERTLTRLGSEVQIKVDVRVIAATNKDLSAAVESGEFRADLFYRLNVILVPIPPLRERPEDIPLLVNHSLKKFSDKLDKPELTIDEGALAMLRHHNWPGNVRELENVLLRAAVNCESSTLKQSDFIGLGDTTKKNDIMSGGLDGAEQDMIRQALERSRGNKTRAAKLLGIDRSTLRRKMNRYNIVIQQV